MNLKYRLADDARPQAKTLLLATLLTFVLWFIPFADLLAYPFRIFVTFIHEGGHALAAVLTGNSVRSLTVSPNASGEVLATGGGWLAPLFISSAGYLGATLYGALLLFLIRRSIAARAVLLGSAGLILTLTLGYGLWNPFTLVSGVLLTLGLVAAAKYLRPRAATFLMSFLAVQCVLNAIFDLKTLLILSSPFATEAAHTDAANMAAATGIPAFFWSFVWIALALVVLSLAMRTYATARRASDSQPDLPFEDEPVL